jgi:hypothetical protein
MDESEEYVRARWKDVEDEVVFGACRIILGTDKVWFRTDDDNLNRAWRKAKFYTIQHEQRIADVEQEIYFLECLKDSGDGPVLTRLHSARFEVLKELKRDLK